MDDARHRARAFDAFEVYRARPRAMTRDADARGASAYPALVFLGDADDADADVEGGARVVARARGTTMVRVRRGNVRALALAPGAVDAVTDAATAATDADADADAAAAAARGTRAAALVSTMLPGFEVEDVRTMMRRGVMVLDPDVWVILLGVEPWRFGVYALEARDIVEAGKKVLRADGDVCFSLRDTLPLFNFTQKRRVDDIRRELEDAFRREKTRFDDEGTDAGAGDARARRASAAMPAVDEVMATMGLVEDTEEEQPSARLLRERLRRKERKIRKRVEQRAAKEASASQTSTEANREIETNERAEVTQSMNLQHAFMPSSARRAEEEVADIENMVPETSDSKGSTCAALACVDCAHSSDCDRKRQLEEVIQMTTAPTDADCTFAYFSSLNKGVDSELLRYLSQTRKRLRTESSETHRPKVADSTEHDALLDADEEWTLVDKRGRAKVRTRAPADVASRPEHDAGVQLSCGDSRNSHAHTDTEQSNASVQFELNKLLTRVVDLTEENRQLKAEMEALKKREGDVAQNLEEATESLLSIKPAPVRPIPATTAVAIDRFYSAEYVARGAAVLSAIHFWFSADNLMRDDFLRSQMDVEGYVPLRTLCAFPSLTRLGLTPLELAGLLEHSPLVELRVDRGACRPGFPPRPRA